MNSMLFAPVPYSASINKSSAYHFGPVRVRILGISAAVACLSFHALLFSPPRFSFSSLPFPVLFSTSNIQSAVAYLHSLLASVKGTAVNSMLLGTDYVHLICTSHLKSTPPPSPSGMSGVKAGLSLQIHSILVPRTIPDRGISGAVTPCSAV